MASKREFQRHVSKRNQFINGFYLFIKWVRNSLTKGIKEVTKVVIMFQNHLQGVINGLRNKVEATSTYFENHFFLKKENSNIEIFRKYIKLRDSLYSIKRNKFNQEIETKYQTQQKENEILKLTAQTQQKELDLQKSKTKTNYALASVFLVVLGGGLFIRKRKKDQKLKLLEESVKSSDQEKIRIGKELHDGIASNLRLLAHDIAIKDINLSHKLLDSYNEIRNLSHQLNNTPIHGEPFLDRVFELMPKNTKKQHFNLQIQPPYLELIEPYSTHVYRIVQELVTNNLKHANATITTISVSVKDHFLTLEYVDNGLNSIKIQKGNGLKSIEDRVALLNGTLAIKADKGFTVAIKVPYKM